MEYNLKIRGLAYMSEAENKDMETFEVELPDAFIAKYFGLGLSEEVLAKKIEAFLLKNIANKDLNAKISSSLSSSLLNNQASFRLNDRKSLKL